MDSGKDINQLIDIKEPLGFVWLMNSPNLLCVSHLIEIVPILNLEAVD